MKASSLYLLAIAKFALALAAHSNVHGYMAVRGLDENSSVLLPRGIDLRSGKRTNSPPLDSSPAKKRAKKDNNSLKSSGSPGGAPKSDKEAAAARGEGSSQQAGPSSPPLKIPLASQKQQQITGQKRKEAPEGSPSPERKSQKPLPMMEIGSSGKIRHNWPKRGQKLGPPIDRSTPSPPPRSPSSSSADSRRGPPWDGRGFTTTASPSEWSNSPGDWENMNAVAKANGPGAAVTRSRWHTGRRPWFREYSEGGDGGSRVFQDKTKVQAAVLTRNQRGDGEVGAEGSRVTVSVDARKSTKGGLISKGGLRLRPEDDGASSGDEEMTKVPPGKKFKRKYISDTGTTDVYAKGQIRGQGVAKATGLDDYGSPYSDELGGSWTSGGGDAERGFRSSRSSSPGN